MPIVDHSGKNKNKPKQAAKDTNPYAATLRLLRSHEGFKAAPYKCPAGFYTIGYGTRIYKDGRKVTETDAPIDKNIAGQLAVKSLDAIYKTIRRNVTRPLTKSQQAALASFIYNVGGTAFAKSELRRKLNEGDDIGAANEFDNWTKAKGKPLGGLIRRRKEEKELFLSEIMNKNNNNRTQASVNQSNKQEPIASLFSEKVQNVADNSAQSSRPTEPTATNENYGLFG